MKTRLATAVVLIASTPAVAATPADLLQPSTAGRNAFALSLATDSDTEDQASDRAWTLIGGLGVNKMRRPWFEDSDVRIDLRPGVQGFVGVSTELSKRWSAELTLGAAWNSISSLDSCGTGQSTNSPLSGVTGTCDCCSSGTGSGGTNQTQICDVDEVCSEGGYGYLLQAPVDIGLAWRAYERPNFHIDLRGGVGIQYTYLQFAGVTVVQNSTSGTDTVATSLHSRGHGLAFHYQVGLSANWTIADNVTLGGYFTYGQAMSAQMGKVYWRDPSNPAAGELNSDPQRLGALRNFGLGVRFTIEF